MANAEVSEIESIIFECGYHRKWARYLIDIAKSVECNHGGHLSEEKPKLLDFVGIGDKTASLYLLSIIL